MDLRLADLLARVVRYFHHTLVSSATARERLTALGVADAAGKQQIGAVA